MSVFITGFPGFIAGNIIKKMASKSDLFPYDNNTKVSCKIPSVVWLVL